MNNRINNPSKRTGTRLLGTLMLTTLISSLSVVHAQQWDLDKSHARIGFTVNHMGFSTIYGDFKEFDGKVNYDAAHPKDTSVNFTIKTDSIDTGWAAREEHLRKAEFFNTASFPTMQFVSTGVTMQGKSKGKITGNLTLLGVTKPVTLNVVMHKRAANPMSKVDTIGFTATTTVKRSDFGMKAYVPMVGDLIPVTIDGELNAVTPAQTETPQVLKTQETVRPAS